MRPVSVARCCATTWFCWRNYNATTPSTDRFDGLGRSPASKSRRLPVKNESKMKFLTKRCESKQTEKYVSKIFFFSLLSTTETIYQRKNLYKQTCYLYNISISGLCWVLFFLVKLLYPTPEILYTSTSKIVILDKSDRK